MRRAPSSTRVSDDATLTPVSAADRLLHAWYQGSRWLWLLAPVAALYWLLSFLRKQYLCAFKQQTLPVPTLIVGNISLGGTGKTPLLIALVEQLRAAGFRPGVISRGYGGAPPTRPYLLSTQSTARESGDEPFSIFKRTGVPVCVDRDRLAAGRCLIEQGCDLLLSDDGLQQYRLGRDFEIIVIDGKRGLGNGCVLPMGPLRETAARLKHADWLVLNSPSESIARQFAQDRAPHHMQISPTRLVEIATNNTYPLTHLSPAAGLSGWQAVAGIGNPSRFADTLNALGVDAPLKTFSDHHGFSAEDFLFAGDNPIIMTEKDAVKCRDFARPNWYYLEVNAVLPEAFWQSLLSQLLAYKRAA